MHQRFANLAPRLARGALAGAFLLCASAAAQLQVIAVPWQGDTSQQHQVFNGGSLLLHGVAVPAAGCPLTSATWDPGDGSGPVAISFANPRVLELAHVYAGANNQPFTATLTVQDSCGNTVSDTFRVVIVDPRTLDVDVNMAIDRGLWNLHKRQVLTSIGAIPSGYWVSQCTASDTASAVQAFEIHGHRASGNPAEDPYVEDVTRGLNHLMTELTTVNIAPQTAGDPDTNGNGIGLETAACGRPIYVGGQVIDAIVASLTPGAVATTGGVNVLGRSYGDIVQDMLDTYFWGQSDPNWGSARGGWRYGWNQDSDNSAAQWAAIGGIAAERVFGSTIPQWVKDENLNFWLAYSQYRDGTFASWDGHFGYGGPFSNVDINMMNTTPSGIVQLDMNAVPNADPRFLAAAAYMVRNWTLLTLNNRIYGMFATAKAYRLAVPGPVHVIASGAVSFDWYRAQTSLGDPVDGVARRLVNIQQGDGSWDGAWVVDDLASAYALIILSSTIVQPGPIAICEADPEITAAGFPVDFDGSLSYHSDPNRTIVNYEWDFEGDGIYDATGVNVTHAYPAQGNYNATLRVTDDTQPFALQSTSVCVIQITPPPFPPDSNPGGPYDFCPQTPPWVLDGSGSTDPDGTIVLYEWDYQPQPPDGVFDATGSTVDVTAYFSGLPPGTYDVALRVTDNNTLNNTDYTTIRVRAQGDPQCQVGPPILNCPPDFTEIWAGGIPVGQTDPSRTGTATYTDACTVNVQLSWQDVSVVPNTIQNPGAPEVVITRRWTLTDGCGGNVTCDQTITLLSPSGQGGGLMLDLQPNLCPNEVWPWTSSVSITIPGTWVYDASDIVASTIRVRRADGVGGALRLSRGLVGPSYGDVTRPYYGQNGPCAAQGGEGRADMTVIASGRAVRNVLKLNTMADGALVNIIVTGKTVAGETVSVMDWLTVRR